MQLLNTTILNAQNLSNPQWVNFNNQSMLLQAGQQYSFESIVKGVCASYNYIIIVFCILVFGFWFLQVSMGIIANIMEYRNKEWKKEHQGFLQWRDHFSDLALGFSSILAAYLLYIYFLS